jgi:CheY-like chemotaxis protein
MARILALDDEPDLLEILVDVLEADGHAVDTAGAAAAALARVAAAAYDLVVSDVQMPGLDGLALYDAMVAADPRLARRYILVTGSGLTSAVRAFVDRTGVRVLHKPYDLRAVQAAVRAALGA